MSGTCYVKKQQYDLIDRLDYLKLIPSYNCNRKCFYCYNSTLQQESEENANKLIETLNDVLSRQNQNFVAEILGGEPLSRKVINITKLLLNLLGRNRYCTKRILTTAVSNINILKDVLQEVDYLYLSTDISPSIKNRKLMPISRIKSVVDICVSNNIDIVLAVVLYGDESESQIDEFVRNAVNAGVRRFAFGHEAFRDHNTDTIQRLAEIYYALFVLKYAYYEQIIMGGGVLETIDIKIRGIERNRICHCGESSISIQPDGSVVPSICFENGPALQSDLYMRMKRERYSSLAVSECNECELWVFCRGGCMGEAVALDSDHCARDRVYCQILKNTWMLVRNDIEMLTKKYS